MSPSTIIRAIERSLNRLFKYLNKFWQQWCPDYLIQGWKLFPTNFANKTWDDVQPTRSLMAWVGATFGFVALLLGPFGLGDPLDSDCSVEGCASSAPDALDVGPPVWFLYEFFYLYKRVKSPEDWDRFKHGQDQSAKVWLALVTVLFGLYFGKDFRTESEKPVNSPRAFVSSRPQPVGSPPPNAHMSKPPAGKTY